MQKSTKNIIVVFSLFTIKWNEKKDNIEKGPLWKYLGCEVSLNLSFKVSGCDLVILWFSDENWNIFVVFPFNFLSSSEELLKWLLWRKLWVYFFCFRSFFNLFLIKKYIKVWWENVCAYSGENRKKILIHILFLYALYIDFNKFLRFYYVNKFDSA